METSSSVLTILDYIVVSGYIKGRWRILDILRAGGTIFLRFSTLEIKEKKRSRIGWIHLPFIAYIWCPLKAASKSRKYNFSSDSNVFGRRTKIQLNR